MSGGKRRAEQEAPNKAELEANDVEELEFEDEFGDDFEEDSDDMEEAMVHGEEGAEVAGAGSSDGPHDGIRPELGSRLWRPGDPLEEGETLEVDQSAYEMLHQMRIDWPCLSFAVVRDNLAAQRTQFPLTTYLVAGTQADKASQNKLLCMKLSHLGKTKPHDSDDDDDSDSDAEDSDPILESQAVPHQGAVNRLKLMPQASHICATWADTAEVHVWDLSKQLANLHAPGSGGGGGPAVNSPVHTFKGHADEGFALDFSPVQQGALASGDCAGRIHVWQHASGGSWSVDTDPYVGHEGSVEDVVWSPVEPGVMLSCGCDSTVRVWDRRKKSGSAITVDEGHGHDVNVASWNRLVNYLVVTGADDGSLRVWDLRSFRKGEPVAKFTWHKAAITSVEWSPQESSTLAVAGADNQITLWDLALEMDPEASSAIEGREDLQDIPPQLYFIHQGQKDIKELHWHEQLPGVISSTAEDSFHIFKPANAGDGPAAD